MCGASTGDRMAPAATAAAAASGGLLESTLAPAGSSPT